VNAPGAVAIWIALALAVVCAVAALVRMRHWKRRAVSEAAVHREAMHSMAFEASNAVNAIRASLLGFRQQNPSAAGREHLEEIERSAGRIAVALHIAGDRLACCDRRDGRPARGGAHAN
jgi:hypothetical protein